MKWVKLGEVASFARMTVTPEDMDPGMSYLGLEHIAKGGALLPHPTVGEAELASAKHAYLPSQVLFGKLRPNLAKIALPCEDGLCSTDILPITPGELLDRRYLAYCLRQPSFVDQAASLATGINLPRVSPSSLAQIRIPLPPLAEQRRIAAILDKADELRTQRRRQLELLDALPQAIFHEMFGDPSMAAQAVPLGEVLNLVGGRNLVADDPEGVSEYRVLKISAVTTGHFRPSESKPLPAGYVPPTEHLVRRGDLLMSRANTADLVGAVAHVTDHPTGLALPDKIWRLHFKTSADPIFYRTLLQSGSMRHQISRLASGTGGSMKNISKTKLLALPVPLVAIEQQRVFAARVSRSDVAAQSARQASAASDALFASLQGRAFRGEL